MSPAALVERDGAFFRPDGSQIPLTRYSSGRRSNDIVIPPHKREQSVFDLLNADSAAGSLNDGRQRVDIFHPDFSGNNEWLNEPKADGQWVMPLPHAD
jgi:hypothetical protein